MITDDVNGDKKNIKIYRMIVWIVIIVFGVTLRAWKVILCDQVFNTFGKILTVEK